MKLFFREYGKGKPIIIAHGLFGMSDNWIPIAKKLAKEYHVYLLDMRNHGQSPNAKLNTYKAMSSDFNEFTEDVKIKNATFIGHSMGGKAVLQFVSDFPEKVNKMIILDISPREYFDFSERLINHEKILKKMQAFNLKSTKSRKEISDHFKSFFNDEFTVQLIQKNITKNKKKQFEWKLNIETLMNSLNEINQEIKFQKKSNIKSLFVFGGNSLYYRAEDKKNIFENFPSAKIKIIKNTGHFLHIEKEKELTEIISTFIG
ncbi:MAG: alpha/beta fold hydrolase [Bacteroidales bacterium]|nr:alpha/beta fold hydrolase [Bacteroidales bacterium]